MTNKKSTKRALLLSILSLVMCVSMLVGSTFAWFTDSVSSMNNVIKSGNLDLKLSYKPYGAENTTWTEVEDDTVVFGKDALYEPGYTEAVWLKVENAGSLAFKYNLALNVYSEKEGINKDGKEFKLSDYLTVKAMTTISTEMESNFYTTRDSLDSFAWGLAGSVDTNFVNQNVVVSNGVAFSKTDTAMAGNDSMYVLVVIQMPTTVGNEANHNGVDIPEILFAINAVATQLAYESDSFDNQYDADADYVTYFTSGTHELNAILKATKATDVITATGADTIVNITGGYYDAGDQDCAVWSKDGATVNIYDGTFTHNGDGTDATSSHHYDMIYAGANGGKINIYGGTFYAKSEGVWLLNERDNDGEIVVYGGTFLNWNPADNVSEGVGTNFVADGYDVVTKETEEGTWYTVVVGVAGNEAELKSMIANATKGGTIILTDNVIINGYAATEKLVIDKPVTIDLNGKTLTTECGWGGIDLKGGASIVNGTINHTGNTAAIKAFQVEKIENVTINVTETKDKTKGGIVVQEGDGCYVGSIKNVTITGATNGIECYRSTNELAIGSMENVTIDATQNGIYLNGAGHIGKISNCEIYGGNIGINAYLANLWHISLDIENSKISGGTSGIDIWDEAKTNAGSTITFNYDDATVFTGGTNNIKVTLQEEITCTINGVKKDTPCMIYQ